MCLKTDYLFIIYCNTNWQCVCVCGGGGGASADKLLMLLWCSDIAVKVLM